MKIKYVVINFNTRTAQHLSNKDPALNKNYEKFAFLV